MVSQCERAFLRAITEINISEDDQPTSHQRNHVDHVRRRILALPINQFRPLLSAHRKQHLTTLVSMDEVFTLLARLAYCARTESHFSIDKIIGLASNDECNMLVPEVLQDGLVRDKARIVVFSCMAWIIMLYSPRPLKPDAHGLFELCIVKSQPVSGAERPICEMIQNFGPLLPLIREEAIPNLHDAAFSAESLYVSLPNARTLCQIGGITIEWVDNVSSHLEFDSETARLMIFRLPSFCDVSRYENTAFSK